MRRSRTLAAVVLLSILAGCGSTPTVDPPAELVDFAPAFYAKVLWSRLLPVRGKSSNAGLRPLIGDDTVYMASDRGVVAAFDATKGKERWRIRTQPGISGGVGATDNLLLVGTREADVLAIGKHDGGMVWRSLVSSEVLAPPVEQDGAVVIRTVDGRVFGLSANSGERLWMHEDAVPSLSLRGLGRPVIHERRVIVGAADGVVRALSLANGEVIWEKVLAAPEGRSELDRLVDVDGDPLLIGDTVYVAAYQGRLAALNAGTGRVLWERDLSSWSGVAGDERNLYVTDDRGRIWALERRTGATLWMQDALRLRSVTRPAVDENRILVGDFAGYLHWLDKDSGQFIARHRIDPKGINVPPVIVNDTAYVAGRGGTLAAVTLAPVKPPPRSVMDRGRR